MSSTRKVAVVTGGARGIGRAISIRLARDGAAVAVWDLRAEAAQETADIILKCGSEAIACAGDASSATDIARCAQETRNALGAVSILVNNAGITSFDSVLSISEAQWDRSHRWRKN